MAVLFPNTELTARRKQHVYERDAHGSPVPAVGFSDPIGPFPGALIIPDAGETANVPWRIRADVRLGPLLPDDELTTSDGRVFIVRTARKCTLLGYDDVDYIAVTGELDPPYSP